VWNEIPTSLFYTLENRMKISTIPRRPFVEGIIRIAAQTPEGSDRPVFNGSMEVLSRHHQPRDEALAVPPLAKHPINEVLMAREQNKQADKLVEIPIRMFFNRTSNALTTTYQAYDADGRPVCRGDGDNAKRSTNEGGVNAITTVPCAGPSACQFANDGTVRCHRQVCMTTQIVGQDNLLSTFEVRSSSYNTYKTLKGQLEYLEARFKGLRHLPLKLQTWKTSNQASSYETFDVFNLALDTATELEAIKIASEARAKEVEFGLDQAIDESFDPPYETGEDDYAIVSDFYAHTRRNGSKSVVSQLIDRTQEPGVSLANSLIEQAIARAGESSERSRAPTGEQEVPV
jgi:hypothetical protein